MINFNNGLWFFLVGLIIFLILRELVTWYFKLNKIIELLEEIKENTKSNEKVNPEKKEKIFRNLKDQPVDKNGNLITENIFSEEYDSEEDIKFKK